MKAAGEIIYLVDDDPRVREGLAELFASLEMMCATFASALDFLGYVRTDTCACLVLDIQLPGLNGLDLQRQLGDDSSPPIIFISGCADIP
jgi:FixJ family two-component response regulator